MASRAVDRTARSLACGALAAGQALWIWSLSARGVGQRRGYWWSVAADGIHYPLFGVLALLLAEALAFLPRGSLARRAVSVAAAGLYGVVDEWHQSSTAGRHGDPWDVVTDLLGAVGFVQFWYGWWGPGSRRAGALWLAASAGLALARIVGVR